MGQTTKFKKKSRVKQLIRKPRVFESGPHAVRMSEQDEKRFCDFPGFAEAIRKSFHPTAISTFSGCPLKVLLGNPLTLQKPHPGPIMDLLAKHTFTALVGGLTLQAISSPFGNLAFCLFSSKGEDLCHS